MSASRTPSPAATTSAGSAESGMTRASGTGSSHEMPSPRRHRRIRVVDGTAEPGRKR